MHNNIKQPKTKTNQKVIRDNNVKKCLKCLDVSRHLDASFSPHFRISVCLFFLVLFFSLEPDLRSTMSSQKPGKTKQKSLLSWVKPQDTKARVEDENVEESCAAEIPEGSSVSGQDYAAVESVKAAGSQLPLLGDRQINQEIYHFLLSPTETGTGPFSRGGLIAIRGCTTLKVLMLYFAIPVSKL